MMKLKGKNLDLLVMWLDGKYYVLDEESYNEGYTEMVRGIVRQITDMIPKHVLKPMDKDYLKELERIHTEVMRDYDGKQ